MYIYAVFNIARFFFCECNDAQNRCSNIPPEPPWNCYPGRGGHLSAPGRPILLKPLGTTLVWCSGRCFTHENHFEILLNQPEIRLYLPFSGWFGNKRTSVWFQVIRKMINTIWFRVDLIRFRKDFHVWNTSPWTSQQCGTDGFKGDP